MSKGPSDMKKGDAFEIEYNGFEITIEYRVKSGLYDGEGDRHLFKATLKNEDGEGSAGFHFWRSDKRVAKIAAKRAIKDYQKKQKPGTAERIANSFS